MQAHEIERYLAELGAALESQGITKPVRMLLIGRAACGALWAGGPCVGSVVTKVG